MKAIFSLSLALLVGAAAAVAAPPPSFNRVFGHQVTGQCDPFAKAAVAMLTARGITAVRITYGWSHFGGPRDYHAAVLFRWEGKTFFMDNQHRRPQVCGQKTDLGCVHHVSGAAFGSMYWMTDENNKHVPARKLDELFEAARLLEKYRKQ